MFRDLKNAVRGLARRPLQSSVAILVLALGLAAGSTAFSFVQTFYQRIPGASAGDRLVSVSFLEDGGRERGAVSYPDYLEYASADQALEGLAGVVILVSGPLRGEDSEEPQWAWGRGVTENFFPVLGIAMHRGRSLSAGADRPGSPPECVLSHGFWQESFGGDESIVGRTVTLRGQSVVVRGIAAAEFKTVFEGFHPDFWISLGGLAALEPRIAEAMAQRDRRMIAPLGRMAPGDNPARVASRLSLVAEGLHVESGASESGKAAPSVLVRPKLRIVDRFREEMQPVLLTMMLAAGVLLALAVANAANVLVAGTLARLRELAIRSALGASRRGIVRLLLSETLLVALCASGLGLLLTVPASELLMWAQFVDGDALLDLSAAPAVTLDLRFYLFVVVVALVAGVLTGTVPALRASRRDPLPDLKSVASTIPTQGGGRRLAMHDLLVAVQVALAAVLLVVAGLTLRSFGQAIDAETNFASEGLVVGTFSLADREMTTDQRRLYLYDLEQRLESEPGVLSAVVTRRVPFGMGFAGRVELDDAEEPVAVEMGAARPGYFETLGLPLRSGRSFEPRDDETAPGVVVVNEAMAERHFPDGHVLGRRLELTSGEGGLEQSFEVIGVVSDVRFGSGDLDWWREPTVYFSLDQYGHTPSGGGFSPGLALLVRSELGLDAGWLDQTLRAHDPDLALGQVLSMDDILRGQLYEQRANAYYFSVLSTLGLILAAAGLWSVLQIAVSRRLQEIGIRRALGAGSGRIVGLVMARGLQAVLAGLGVGLVVAFFLSRTVQSLVYDGISPTDPWAFVLAALVLLAVAVAACLLPAVRAVRADPLDCLRQE